MLFRGSKHFHAVALSKDNLLSLEPTEVTYRLKIEGGVPTN